MYRSLPLIVVFCGFGASCAYQAPQKQNFSGNYQTIESRTDSQLSLEVHQQEETATIDIAAANASGRGVAPDGSGKGQIETDGNLHFKFEDSFGNQGAGVLKVAGTKYQLMLDITSVKEPSALVHYGSRTLQKK